MVRVCLLAGIAALAFVGAAMLMVVVNDEVLPGFFRYVGLGDVDPPTRVLSILVATQQIAFGFGLALVFRALGRTRYAAVGVAVLVLIGAFPLFALSKLVLDGSPRSTRELVLLAILLIVASIVARYAYRAVRRPAPMPSAAPKLFQAGTAEPPLLAGREQEQALLSRYLSTLRDGHAPPSDVMLTGPRGTGKTALLRWFEETCGSAGAEVVDVSPTRVETTQDLCNVLLPAGLQDWLPARLRVGAEGVGSVEWHKMSDSAKSAFMDRLAARGGNRPVVVLVDEAHTLNVDVGKYLLNVSQDIRRRAPFLLVLAGTPGLPAHLRKMDASFWDRNRRLGIGRLSQAAAKEALQEPLGALGKSIDVVALDSVVEHSQRYAYFIQIWGEELWQGHSDKEETLTAEFVASVQDNVERRMTDYYIERYRELEERHLLPAAEAIAAAFQSDMNVTATDEDVDNALATAYENERKRLRVRDELNELGYVWCPPGQKPPVVWHAGIPSLMQHVLNGAPRRRAKRSS